MIRNHTHNRRAIVANREDLTPVQTDEIADLARAAGYSVVATVTQVRTEDPGLYLGKGKVVELAEMVDDRDASTVVIDGDLTPAQHRNITDRLSPQTQLLDRIRLVLDIFADQVSDRRAKLQVERERLRDELARYDASADEGWFNRRTEKGSPRYDMLDRIDHIDRTLDAMVDPSEQMRQQRQEQGFDLVTIAGYTNAGKSTLLHRLADDLDLASQSARHPDEDTVAGIEDRLFKTLETTTRRVTIRGRPVLCTDTVGYVEELPHRLIASFSETLSEAEAADLVILVTDGSDDATRFREKLQVSLDVLNEQGVSNETILPVVNKVDQLDPHQRAERVDIVEGLLGETLPISALHGTNIDRLLDVLYERLPSSRQRFELPYNDDSMSMVARAYDAMHVSEVTYTEDRISIDVEGRPAVIHQFAAQVDELRDPAKR